MSVFGPPPGGGFSAFGNGIRHEGGAYLPPYGPLSVFGGGPRALPRVRYWRIVPLGTAYAGTPWFSLNEVTMAASSGGAQLATGGTAIGAGSGFSVGNGFANAFDGSAATFVQGITPATTPSCWIGYVFPSAVSIGAIGITARSTAETETLAGFVPQYSTDGVTWTSLEPSLPMPTWTPSETKWTTLSKPSSNTRAKARLWRIGNILGGGSRGMHKVYYRATSGGATLCVGGAHWGLNGTNATVAPYRCFDGTLVSSLFGTADNGFVNYLFPTAPNPGFLAIQKPTSGNVATDPTSFDIQWSPDGVTFTTALSVPTPGTWTSGETKEWTIP